MAASNLTIEATDLSPIPGLGDTDDAWLRRLARHANTDTLTLRLSQRTDEDDPIVSFDARSGQWWTGRYIGEVTFENGTLCILPRFGVPQLQRWLSRIWGVRVLSSKGKYEAARLWLWELLAKLWEVRLLAAAKHGLPTRRFDEVHRGPAIRGRLDIRGTARELGAGHHALVSWSRNRSIDRGIASVLLCAFENLRTQLRHHGDHRSWLTTRAQGIVGSLQGQYGRSASTSSVAVKEPLRYTPITESYRSVVDLSLAIIQHRPMSSTADGQRDVLGVLVDMAEVWELYVYQLLRANLLDLEVMHAGRAVENEAYLLRSTVMEARLAGLKPDILVRPFGSNRILTILDAKYKSTTRQPDRPSGVQREDLYQMNAYLSALGPPEGPVSGALVYPEDREKSEIPRLLEASPWSIACPQSSLWFLGIDCELDDAGIIALTGSEEMFVEKVREIAHWTVGERTAL